MLSIYLHFVLKHYYNYYTKQVHFQWKITHYILSTSKPEQVLSDLLRQLWQQSRSHSIGRKVNIIIICCYLNVIVIGILSVLSFTIPLLNCNGLPSFTMEDFLVIFFPAKWRSVYLADAKSFTLCYYF